MPSVVEPMLATLAPLPRDGHGWGYEFKWDGVRAVLFIEHGRVRAQARSLRDITHEYPEVQALAAAVDGDAILDGEIVALDEGGVPRFERLQQRFGLTRRADVEARMGEVPAVFLAYDLLWHDGGSLLRAPYETRRARLDDLALSGDDFTVPPWHQGNGLGVLELSRERGLEGIVAKRLGSAYQPGTRSPDWRKVKNRARQEFVVGGYTLGEGAREGTVGALLVGVYDGNRFVYAGKVGTGLTDATLRDLRARLRPLERPQSPFTEGDPPRGALWVEPRLVAEVEFAEFTRDGLVRAGAFKGLRFDMEPGAVVREVARPEQEES